MNISLLFGQEIEESSTFKAIVREKNSKLYDLIKEFGREEMKRHGTEQSLDDTQQSSSGAESPDKFDSINLNIEEATSSSDAASSSSASLHDGLVSKIKEMKIPNPISLDDKVSKLDEVDEDEADAEAQEEGDENDGSPLDRVTR
ncbi:unnamed protein product [Ambrosiozyma monospora]|uniref:Unnamed protein product n=1 Tax=Ambrosiozyma monospora TaxID=43982 RepID=A0ACB5UCP0_AMBMO|nr:unnamed protein product [Ambrosiozyma monospora]